MADDEEARISDLEERIRKLEDLLQQIAGMAKLLRWLFWALLLIGGPLLADRTRQVLIAWAK